MFFIDPDGTVNLVRLLLSPGYSVDIVARSYDRFFGGHFKDAFTLVDSRLQLRCVLNFTPQNEEQKNLVKSLEKHGWYFRVHTNLASADTIIVDGEYTVVATNNILSQNERVEVHYSEDLEFCSKTHQHFNYLWDKSVEVIYEDLFASSIPSVQQQILTTGTEYWNELLSKLIHNPHNLFTMQPRKFEELVAELLTREGFSVTLTPATRDGGRDILASNRNYLGEHLYLVECKRYASNRPVDVSLVRTLYGVVEAERASAGLLVTTSYFTKDAVKFRETIRHRMGLRDYNELVTWLHSGLNH